MRKRSKMYGGLHIVFNVLCVNGVNWEGMGRIFLLFL